MLEILGKEKNEKPLKDSRPGLFWQMQELENAFHFFMAELPEIEPLFLEYDELTAIGEAYKERGPLNILDVLDTLEKLAPEFAGIEVAEGVKLLRTRLSQSQGLILEVEGKPFYFMRDETLKTINFLDFYRDSLADKIKIFSAEGNGENIIEKNKNTNPGLRLSGTGGS
jgi:triphosphoribosyl-dephospho-CoA synthetase